MTAVVRVPASSANLGSGFDALGMALTMRATFGRYDADQQMPGRARVVDEFHPAHVAFRRAGGSGSIWVGSSIPNGRGLGFSGTMRVGGAALAHLDDAGLSTEALDAVLQVATELEGHADNAAAHGEQSARRVRAAVRRRRQQQRPHGRHAERQEHPRLGPRPAPAYPSGIVGAHS